MSAKTTALCPCQSSLSYEDCCGRFHSGNMFPETAEQLMRSRYSAFVLKKIPYIVQTTVPSQQTLLDEKALQDWANETQWLGLEIVKAETLTKVRRNTIAIHQHKVRLNLKHIFKAENSRKCITNILFL